MNPTYLRQTMAPKGMARGEELAPLLFKGAGDESVRDTVLMLVNEIGKSTGPAQTHAAASLHAYLIAIDSALRFLAESGIKLEIGARKEAYFQSLAGMER